jgi:hypothetical protein
MSTTSGPGRFESDATADPAQKAHPMTERCPEATPSAASWSPHRMPFG